MCCWRCWRPGPRWPASSRSKTASAPVEWCRALLKRGQVRALVVNSGNANAFTGQAGQAGVRAVAEAAAAVVGCKTSEVFLASTGVIGEPLASEKITKILTKVADDASASGWRAAAEAIMTTDTFPKLATASATIDGVKVTLNGIAKGSGMIAPGMATMLSFLFTDAAISAAALQSMVAASVDRSFNCLTVDGDTSTSDTVLVCATGAAGHAPAAAAGDSRLAGFRRALTDLMTDLAKQVVA